MLLRWGDGSEIGVCLADTFRWDGWCAGKTWELRLVARTVVDKLLQGWLVARKRQLVRYSHLSLCIHPHVRVCIASPGACRC